MCVAKQCAIVFPIHYIVNHGIPLGWTAGRAGMHTAGRRVHCVAILTLLAFGGLLAETPRIGGGSVQAHTSSHPQVVLAI